MNKQDILDYFEEHASTWDAEMIRSDAIIGTILDNARIGAGSRVLDVACGTGVLIPDYLARCAAQITAVDISPEMIKIASGKFPLDNVRFICGDAETAELGTDYDAVMIYNAFPHFPEPEKIIARLASLLVPGGTLSVAHGMSREQIDRHHHGSARHVSVGLMPADELSAIFAKYLEVTAAVSDDRMYQIVGTRRI